MKFKDTDYGDLNGQTHKGDIDVRNINLTSLEGAPKIVKGDFNCASNLKLTSLKNAPESVIGNFYCNGNSNLTSLEGAPKSVKGDFDCSYNKNLTSLEGAPKNVSGYCSNDPKLTQSEIDKLVE